MTKTTLYPYLSGAAVVALLAGCTMAEQPVSAKAPNLVAEVLPAEQIAYSAIGPDGTSVTGFGSGSPVMVTATDGTVLDSRHAAAALAVATLACQGAGHDAPAPEAVAYTGGGIRFQRCG